MHGVTADMVADAPTFDQIAEELAARVHESLVCAHNLPFDIRMLTAEYEAAGLDVSLTGVDTLALAGGRLAVACERYGVVLDGAHRALHDARACAQLLLHVAAHASVPPSASIVHSPTSPTGHSRCRARPAHNTVIEAPPSKLAAWVARLDHSGAASALQSYLDVLDRAMADLHLDAHEIAELEALASGLGLSAAQMVTAHRRWLDDLIDAACADGVVDDVEYDGLLRAAHVLEVPTDRVEKRTATRRTTTRAVTADLGVGVAFTGVPLDANGYEIPRGELMEHAARIGMVPEDKFAKSRCGLLVAADPSSQSGKAAKARGWGIPIVVRVSIRPTSREVQGVDNDAIVHEEYAPSSSAARSTRAATSSSRDTDRVVTLLALEGDPDPSMITEAKEFFL
ncbi:MAG: 3'-5' exonuclease [Acidimicrobiales bacterium]|nr:3'-5' exonuclease [Acidimicrobiales bacterium]